MSIERINSLDDLRVAPFCNLKDRELAKQGDRFIAEGEYIVRRLLNSDFPTESVMLSERREAEIAPLVPAGVPVYVVSEELMRQIIGFHFHSGVIACARRKPSASLEEVAGRSGRLTLVVCPEVANAENMGSLIRLSAGFGADAMILGERSCDPFWRQSVRVSMGTIFRLPLVRSRDVLADMKRLREEFGVELAATVLADDAESLATAKRRERFGVLFGNEAQGLAAEHVAACDRRVTIPMRLGTDSLNVAVAAGIFLYHFTREETFG